MEENQAPTGPRKESVTRMKSIHGQRSQKRVTTATSVVAVMTISFYLCWTPYATISLMSILSFSITVAASVVALLFAKLGVVGNPIIYIFFNKDVNIKKPISHEIM